MSSFIINPYRFVTTAAPVAGYYIWLKHDAGVTQVSNRVSKWTDQSANAFEFSQGTGANQPYYVAGDGIQFVGGSNEALVKTSGLSLPEAYTLFVVCDSSGTTTSSVLVSPQGDYCQHYMNGDGGLLGAYNYDTTDRWVRYNQGADSFSTIVYCCVVNGASSAVYKNNVSQATGSLGTVATETNLAIGNAYSSGDAWHGKIKEILWYNSVLSAGDLATMQSYFESRYSL